MFESFSQIEPIVFVAKHKHGAELQEAASAISEIKNQLETTSFDEKEVERLAEQSKSLIRKITNDTHALLTKAEEELALGIISESMSSLAYKVRTSGMALTASKGDVSVNARIAGGRIRLDTTSFPGISCQAEIKRIEDELERRGLVLRRLCENGVKIRKEKVRLKDQFPVLPVRHLNRNSAEQKVSALRREPERSVRGHVDSLVRGRLRQMELIKVREE